MLIGDGVRLTAPVPVCHNMGSKQTKNCVESLSEHSWWCSVKMSKTDSDPHYIKVSMPSAL